MQTREKIFNPPVKKHTSPQQATQTSPLHSRQIVMYRGQSFIFRNLERYCGVTSRYEAIILSCT